MSDDTHQSALKSVIIFTDGAAVPNPGAGGYGVVLRFGKHNKELSGGYQRTTNNRMEMMAVIVGLEALKERCQVILHSDSQYVVNAITTGSAFRWRNNGWGMNPSGSKKAKNPDLWERLLAAYEKHEVELAWVKGHAGIEDNERCDVLAMEACKQSDLPADSGFVEKSSDENEDGASEVTIGPKHKGPVTDEGQPCRNCGTPVVKRIPKKQTVKKDQSYYFAWYLFCPNCKNMYMVEAAKREVESDGHRRRESDTVSGPLADEDQSETLAGP